MAVTFLLSWWLMQRTLQGPNPKIQLFLPEAKQTGLVEAMSVRPSVVAFSHFRGQAGPDATHHDPYDSL